jgi:hypothetical protein
VRIGQLPTLFWPFDKALKTGYIFTMERLNPLNDYLFLKVMGEKGDEEQCIAFINAILADSSENPLRLVKILENRSISSENLGDKSVVLDFRALAETDIKKNIKVNIEVQVLSEISDNNCNLSKYIIRVIFIKSMRESIYWKFTRIIKLFQEVRHKRPLWF